MLICKNPPEPLAEAFLGCMTAPVLFSRLNEKSFKHDKCDRKGKQGSCEMQENRQGYGRGVFGLVLS